MSSDMEISAAPSVATAVEEGGIEGGTEYPHLPPPMSRDGQTSGCSSAGSQAMQAGRLQGKDGSSGSEKSLNGSVVWRSGDGEQRRMVDITRDKPIKVTVRIMVPVRDHPKFNFVGKLLGPKGNSLKRLQEDTMTKMAILGRGSMRDKHKEEELRLSGDHKFSHLNDDLHVEVTAFAPPAEAHARIAYALAEVRRFLVPDYNDDIRQEQMWEMQILNTQRKPGSAGLINEINCSLGTDHHSNSSVTSSDSRNGSLSPSSPPSGNAVLVPQELLQHPALRGVEQRAVAVNPTSGSNTVCRKRPLLAGAGTRLAMSPTKRTVLSILARARAAQAKELPDYHQPSNNGRSTGIPVLRDDPITGANLV